MESPLWGVGHFSGNCGLVWWHPDSHFRTETLDHPLPGLFPSDGLQMNSCGSCRPPPPLHLWAATLLWSAGVDTQGLDSLGATRLRSFLRDQQKSLLNLCYGLNSSSTQSFVPHSLQMCIFRVFSPDFLPTNLHLTVYSPNTGGYKSPGLHLNDVTHVTLPLNCSYQSTTPSCIFLFLFSPALSLIFKGPLPWISCFLCH